jgi:uncharacterized protein (DUF488 family)
MPTLYTIGHKGKSLQAFIERLQGAGVDAIVDIRLRNTSHLLGYTKRDDLTFLLQSGFGIAYEHCPELAPTEEILLAFRQDKDWAAYTRQFVPLLSERRVEEHGRRLLARYTAPCLLCAEASAEECHRGLVAEYLAQQIPELDVVHL